MQILLPDNHPSLARSFEVGELLKTNFPESPLSYFQHCKIHANGDISVITNNAHWMKTALKLNMRKVYSCIKTEFIDKNSYWFLWDHNLFDAPLSLARNEFNIANGLCFVERHKDFYYLTAFATNNAFVPAVDYYLTNFDKLRNFIHTFRSTQIELLTELDANKISLTKPAQDPNKDLLLLPANTKRTRIPVSFGKITSYLTPQEYTCISQLPFGKTAKEIGKELSLSYRTVEGYFSRVMLRTGCKNKRDLIALLEPSSL